jgi:glycosyltransferase involved in cell wall biosynthesis
MSRTILVQPSARGRISGGYLYNAKMAAGGAWDLWDVDMDDLSAGLDGTEHRLVLADSIWLTEERIQPFLRLRERRQSVGAMLHSFPSMIEAAESGRGAAGAPSAFELEALETLGLAIVPGPHYASMLAARSIEVHAFEPGVDDEWRSPPRKRHDRCALVSVGAVTRRKGFLDVVEALERRAPCDDYRWTVVGSLSVDREYADAVRERAASLGTVVFAGQRSPNETRAIVQQADILVMPSYDENHPLVLLEAMAASVPSVVYAAGAALHIVGDGRAGLVSSIGDRDRLGANIARLLDDEAERYRLAENCWELQRSLPSWTAAAQHATETLRRLGR